MHTGTGRIVELLLEDDCLYAHISCAESLVPGPGQYSLASHSLDSLLPVPLFHTDIAPQGFISPAPERWRPGDQLALRGPLGRGFSLPISARKVGLIAYDGPASRLRSLIQPSLRQSASVVLLCNSSTNQLPDEVEIQPLSALGEILMWADYLALDIARENLKELLEKVDGEKAQSALNAAQVLVRASMPCGGLADCGVCALTTRSEWKMVCREGPVFGMWEI